VQECLGFRLCGRRAINSSALMSAFRFSMRSKFGTCENQLWVETRPNEAINGLNDEWPRIASGAPRAKLSNCTDVKRTLTRAASSLRPSAARKIELGADHDAAFFGNQDDPLSHRRDKVW
jgi:hypothetical protein